MAKENNQGQQMQMEAEKSADTANVAAGVAGTAANIAATLDSGGGSKTPKRPDVEMPTEADMAKLDAKVGAVPTQQQVVSELNDIVGENAPKKIKA